MTINKEELGAALKRLAGADVVVSMGHGARTEGRLFLNRSPNGQLLAFSPIMAWKTMWASSSLLRIELGRRSGQNQSKVFTEVSDEEKQ